MALHGSSSPCLSYLRWFIQSNIYILERNLLKVLEYKEKRGSYREKETTKSLIQLRLQGSIRHSWVAFAVGFPSPLLNLIRRGFATCCR